MNLSIALFLYTRETADAVGVKPPPMGEFRCHGDLALMSFCSRIFLLKSSYSLRTYTQ